jgi:hypothetical protein
MAAARLLQGGSAPVNISPIVGGLSTMLTRSTAKALLTNRYVLFWGYSSMGFNGCLG